MAKVSIIMGIYNCAKTLPEAIDSIIAQTFTDWQLIMCDDGSIDNTYMVAKAYVDNDPSRFILLQNEHNMGLNHTLNRCLSEATGAYVARMDGDDISVPTRLEKEVRFLDENPEYSIVSSTMILFDENGEWGKSQTIEKPTKRDFIKHSPVHSHAPCMIRREAYMAVGGYTEDKRMLRFEDVNLWYKLYAKGYIGYNISEPLYRMRDDRAAARRRSLKSRMNGVYVTYVGLKLFDAPWYMYWYVVVDFLKHLVKGAMPEQAYLWFHKKAIRKER